MILGEHSIRKAIADGRITITGSEHLHINDGDGIEPASIDLRLGDTLLRPLPNLWSGDVPMTDLSKPVDYETQTGKTLCVPSLGFRLGVTMERVTLDVSLVAFVEGRSSVGRGGLFIQNAGWVDPGFDGTITLELFNAGAHPLIIPAHTRICQIVIAEVEGGTQYKGKYQGQGRLPRGSEFYRDCPE